MDTKNYETQADFQRIDRKNLIQGSIFLVIFLVLIIAGIVAKRVYGKDALTVITFHLPAAVFLVVGTMKITAKNRRYFTNHKIPSTSKK